MLAELFIMPNAQRNIMVAESYNINAKYFNGGRIIW